MNLKFWLALFTCVAALHAASDPPALKVGDPFPDISKSKIEGKFPDLKGKVVLIDFWATWCPPCKKSFPVLKYLHERYAACGFDILSICLDSEKAPMQAFLKEYPVPFTTLWDPDSQIANLLNIGQLPYSYLVGPDGKILAIHEKFNADETPILYNREIKAALPEAAPKPRPAAK